LPVRSAVLKQCTGRLLVRWVTTSESLLLYVVAFCSTALPLPQLQEYVMNIRPIMSHTTIGH
ncbi:hypothetical protein EJ02DRAFT_359663, partial [Clathrospora elynae]